MIAVMYNTEISPVEIAQTLIYLPLTGTDEILF